MDPLTHAATGVLLSQVLRTPSRGWAALAGVLFGVLPDIDYFLIFWDRLAFIRHHRGFTHSLVALPLLALAGAGLGRLIGGPRWFRPLFFLGLAVLGSHLALDWITSYGTQLLNPFTRRRFSLDWVFIIDPYLTALLLAGVILALALPAFSRRLAAAFLTAGAAYIVICAVYHHQALNLAHRVLAPDIPSQTAAALPQPFSCRRWHLLAPGEDAIRQAYVLLPYNPVSRITTAGAAAPPSIASAATGPLYQAPDKLTVRSCRRMQFPATPVSPGAEAVLATYLEFARFPILHLVRQSGEEELLEWLDLRFAMPGRSAPFALRLRLDPQGRLRQWMIGRRG